MKKLFTLLFLLAFPIVAFTQTTQPRNANNLTIGSDPSTNSSGIIYRGTYPFLHSYSDPTGSGANLFLGVSSGNFTMTPNGGGSSLASNNTGIGYGTLQSLTTGNRNSAFGVDALMSDTTGDHNIAFGQNALLMNVDGIYNTALGIDAMHNNVSGSYNVAIGQNALLNMNLSGSPLSQYNVSVGYNSMSSLTSGYNNVGIGAGALNNLTTGYENSALGYGAGYSITNHIYNVSIGYDAGYSADANYNTFIGGYAGEATTGGSNVLIGAQTTTKAASDSNEIVIGASNAGIGSYGVAIGGIDGYSTAPTIASGFGSSPSISGGNSTFAFEITIGASPGTTGVLNMGTAPTSWNCFCNDLSQETTSVSSCKQTVASATQVTLGFFSDIAGAASPTSADKIRVNCMAY